MFGKTTFNGVLADDMEAVMHERSFIEHVTRQEQDVGLSVWRGGGTSRETTYTLEVFNGNMRKFAGMVRILSGPLLLMVEDGFLELRLKIHKTGEFF